MPKAKVAAKVVVKKPTISKKSKSREKKGLQIERFFTKQGEHPLENIKYELRSCTISHPNGDVAFELKDIEVPVNWSKVASDVLISKYIRKGGVPQFDKLGQAIKNKDGSPVLGSEKSVKHVVSRMAGTWRYWGEKHKYFASRRDAQIFEEEALHMLINQISAPNSPQWFNTGLNFAYNITGPAQGHWYADPKTGKLKLSEDAYTRSQTSACFIQSVNDDLVNKNGIFDLITKEARIFKYGSGTGSNFSRLRGAGEPLSGGGSSSGLMSWLRIFDRAAGAIKSGGTTRRAAKMVILDVDHPDIESFVDWKHKEEEKAAKLIAAGYSSGIDGEAYSTVSGQNSNNSVRVDDEFMKAVLNDADWHLRWRIDKNHIAKTIKAKTIWEKIAKSTWECGDPGVQFDTTVNDWHTCLASGRINGSNPCSEFMFLDDSSCNLASINLIKFYDPDKGEFDVKGFAHSVRMVTIIQDISILMAQFPSYEIAKNSYLFRPIGLGYANLGALLMLMGYPYDSVEGRGVAGAITAMMTGESYAASAEMAKIVGPFKMYEKNKEDMLRVIRNHRRAAYNTPGEEFEKLSLIPWTLKDDECPTDILKAARDAWDKALLDGGRFGFRNAQTTVLAPTGTIGLVMDCDTTGIEPDYALVKFKKLVGGGYFKIINQSVPKALEKLGLNKDEIADIVRYVIGSGSLENSPHINRATLLTKGFSPSEIDIMEAKLPGVFDLSQAISKLALGDEIVTRIGFKEADLNDPNFNLLEKLGFSKEQIKEANDFICGIMTVEGAPHLKDEYLPIFDCASKCGQYGKRFILPEGHIEMMAATQPFLSGAISKTVNLQKEATVDDVERIYLESWRYGLKAVAIYRDGSKLDQPLSSENNSDGKINATDKEVVIEYRPVRRRLPKERHSITRKMTIGGHKIFITVGLYEDGKPGELFIIMNQQGSFAAGMADSFAKMVSIGLQYGVPVETIVSQLRHMRFQPMGFTSDSDISSVSSISDFIAQWFEKRFSKNALLAMKLPFDSVGSEVKDVEAENDGKLSMADESAEFETKDLASMAQELGFTGEMCAECGQATMVQNGKCQKCVSCGATTGCS